MMQVEIPKVIEEFMAPMVVFSRPIKGLCEKVPTYQELAEKFMVAGIRHGLEKMYTKRSVDAFMKALQGPKAYCDWTVLVKKR